MATDTAQSVCCDADYLWLWCDECGDSANEGEGHYFATCSACGADIDD